MARSTTSSTGTCLIGVRDDDRDEQRVSVARDLRPVARLVINASVFNAARCAASRRQAKDESSELRRVDGEAKRTDDDKIGRSARGVRRKRSGNHLVGPLRFRVIRRMAVRSQTPEHQGKRRDREHDRTDPGADRAPRMATTRPGQKLGDGHATSVHLETGSCPATSGGRLRFAGNR